MKKTEEMSRAIGVEELVAVAKKHPEEYTALRHYCMNRGFAELRRFAKRVVDSSGKAPLVNDALSEKQNTKLVVLIIRIVETQKNATAMYHMFHLCDNAVEAENAPTGEEHEAE